MKYILLCILLYMHLYLARNIKRNNMFLRIMGGRNATEDEFPYVVKIMLQALATRMQHQFICTASVLTSKWTLTAGHCIGAVELQISGASIPSKPVVEYQPSPKAEFAYSEILSMTIHPNFKERPAKNDIGLLRTQPVLFTVYGKLSPLDYATLNGQQVSLVGYGWISNKRIKGYPHLPQVLEVIVKECSFTRHYPQLCFAPSCSMHVHDFRALCPGDSGGPAVHASGIVSVFSMFDGRTCGILVDTISRDRYDTGYDVGSATPVSPFIDWISSVMKTDIV